MFLVKRNNRNVHVCPVFRFHIGSLYPRSYGAGVLATGEKQRFLIYFIVYAYAIYEIIMQKIHARASAPARTRLTDEIRTSFNPHPFQRALCLRPSVVVVLHYRPAWVPLSVSGFHFQE